MSYHYTRPLWNVEASPNTLERFFDGSGVAVHRTPLGREHFSFYLAEPVATAWPLGAPTSLVTITIVDLADDTTRMWEWLRQAEPNLRYHGSGVIIDNRAAARRLASGVTRWLRGTTQDFAIQVDGAGAVSVLNRLDYPNLERVVADMIEAAAPM